MNDLALFALLLIAVAAGWFVGKRSSRQAMPADEARGDAKHPLQLLFDSYNDTAIDDLLRNTEISKDTISLHLSIGRHFRNEGEVDRAILIHQNLLSQPQLASYELQPVIFELACDYKAAGMFDRAEALLDELLSSKEFSVRARSLLLELHERQGDWQQAISLIGRWDRRKDSTLAVRLSHYHCELAETALDSGALEQAEAALKAAQKALRSSPRANLLKAKMAMESHDFAVAVRTLRTMVSEDSAYVSLALPLLKECSQRSETESKMSEFLEQEYQRSGSTQMLLFLAGLHAEQGMNAEARALFETHLRSKPSLKALQRYVSLLDDTGIAACKETLSHVLAELLQDEKSFICGNCGFHGQQFHWQCPSCRSWQTVKAVLH